MINTKKSEMEETWISLKLFLLFSQSFSSSLSLPKAFRLWRTEKKIKTNDLKPKNRLSDSFLFLGVLLLLKTKKTCTITAINKTLASPEYSIPSCKIKNNGK